MAADLIRQIKACLAFICANHYYDQTGCYLLAAAVFCLVPPRAPVLHRRLQVQLVVFSF